MLGQPENRGAVEAAVARTGGRPFQVEFEASATPDPAPADSRPVGQSDLIEEIKNMFDAVEESDA